MGYGSERIGIRRLLEIGKELDNKEISAIAITQGYYWLGEEEMAELGYGDD